MACVWTGKRPRNPGWITFILVYLIAIIAFFRDQPNWEKSAEEKDTEVEKKMINFNVTDADRNEFGEKYIWQRVKSDIGLLHLPIIIGVYSAFCNFLAQSGLILGRVQSGRSNFGSKDCLLSS